MNSKQFFQYGVIIAAVVLLGAVYFTSGDKDAATGETAVAAGVEAPATPTPGAAASVKPTTTAKAVLDVQGMSCSGCIYTIKSSLAGMDGVGEVLVDLSAGQAEVYFDPQKVRDVAAIAAAITRSGYPATVKQILTADQAAEEESLLVAKARRYIAAVGDWEIARDDFEVEMTYAKNRYAQIYGASVFAEDRGEALLQNLKAQVAAQLVDEAVQMQEVRKAGYRLPPAVLKSELSAYLKQKNMSEAQLKALLAGSGFNYDYFMKKFENQAAIKNYVDDRVLSGISGDVERRRRYVDWYNNARLLAKVTYYDRDLEAAVNSASAGSGCGSSCTRQGS
jgi:copper chaperone CopZ